MVLPCPRRTPGYATATPDIVPADAPIDCATDLTAALWLDAPATLEVTYRGGPTAQTVKAGGRTFRIPARGTATVRVAVARGYSQSAVTQGWRSSAGTPTIARVELARRRRRRVAPGMTHVFGYGSLVALPGARPAVLRGWRRVWGVAMDNAVAVPGYKVYERPDGTRPACAVAFLDLEPADGAEVGGALIEADPAGLEALDARERQYERIDVTAAIAPAPGPAGARVWTYVGRPPGRARVAAGRAGTAPVVIQKSYAELVERAFAALGDEALARYRASTEPPPFPVADLARVDL